MLTGAECSMGSDLLIWSSNPDGVRNNIVIHVPEINGDRITCVKLCPTGQNQPSIEKRGALILYSDHTILAVGSASPEWIPRHDLKDVIDVTTGFSHAIAVTGGDSIAIGGFGVASPDKVPGGLSNVVAVAAGADSYLAVSSNGTITGWGSWGIDRRWQGAADVMAVSLAQDMSSGNGMALRRDGTVLQWSRRMNASPVAGISNIIAIAASPAHFLALTREAKVVAWKSNGLQTSITSVPAGLTNIVSIAAGFEHISAFGVIGSSLALRNDGTLVGWREGGGDVMPPGISNVVAIAAGADFCMALTTNSAVAEHFLRTNLVK